MAPEMTKLPYLDDDDIFVMLTAEIPEIDNPENDNQ